MITPTRMLWDSFGSLVQMGPILAITGKESCVSIWWRERVSYIQMVSHCRSGLGGQQAFSMVQSNVRITPATTSQLWEKETGLVPDLLAFPTVICTQHSLAGLKDLGHYFNFYRSLTIVNQHNLFIWGDKTFHCGCYVVYILFGDVAEHSLNRKLWPFIFWSLCAK